MATTADCWTSALKAYIGMTVHWLDTSTRQRRSGVLACVRLPGRHTYDVLAEAMERVHVEFHIEQKVTMTTTDNASNFCKAFVQFGAERDLIPEKPICSQDNVNDPQDELEQLLNDDDNEDAQGDETGVEFVCADDIAEAGDAEEEYTPRLAGHMRCGAHTWNLIASKDSDKALNNAVFKRAYRAALAKAKALWNRQNQSTVAADAIYTELKKRLVVPNDTRWNSMFDAMVCLTKIIQEKRDGLRRVMVQQSIAAFTQQDIEVMEEYVKAMQPIAIALDKIQGNTNGYLGWLLPLSVTTVIRLREVRNNLTHCRPLVDAMLEGIKKRFDPMLENEECLLAAAFHPR